MKSAIYADAPEVGSVLKVSVISLKEISHEFSNQFFKQSLDRKESTLRVWDHRFAKRSFCGGLWSRGAAKVKRKFSIKILLINVCQTLSENNGLNFFIGSTPSHQFQPSSRNSRLISYCPFSFYILLLSKHYCPKKFFRVPLKIQTLAKFVASNKSPT